MYALHLVQSVCRDEGRDEGRPTWHDAFVAEAEQAVLARWKSDFEESREEGRKIRLRVASALLHARRNSAAFLSLVVPELIGHSAGAAAVAGHPALPLETRLRAVAHLASSNKQFGLLAAIPDAQLAGPLREEILRIVARRGSDLSSLQRLIPPDHPAVGADVERAAELLPRRFRKDWMRAGGHLRNATTPARLLRWIAEADDEHLRDLILRHLGRQAAACHPAAQHALHTNDDLGDHGHPSMVGGGDMAASFGSSSPL